MLLPKFFDFFLISRAYKLIIIVVDTGFLERFYAAHEIEEANSSRKNIRFMPIVRSDELRFANIDYFRCHIGTCTTIFGEFFGHLVSRKSKIGQFQGEIFRNEQILRFYVQMCYLFALQIFQAIYQLSEEE